MSAFIVGDAHINAMLQDTGSQFQGVSPAYSWEGEMHYLNGHKQEVGQKLLDENYRSVNYRYGESEKAPDFQSTYPTRRYSSVEIVKLCDCYRYQTCETPDWKDTEAYAIMQMLHERAISNLPGYREADWAIRE